MTDTTEDVGGLEGLAEATEEELEGLAQQVAAELPRVQLWRRETGFHGPLGYLGSLGTGELTLEYVAETWGGGDYSIRFCDAAGHVKRAIPVKILGAPRFLKKASKEEEEEGGAAPAWARELTRRLERLEGKGSSSSSEFLALAVQIATTMATAQSQLLTPLLERLGNAGDGGGMGAADVLSLARELVEFSQDAGGRDRGGDSLIRDLGLPIVQTLRNLAGQEPAGAAHATLQPAAEVATMQTTLEDSRPVPAWVRTLRPYMPQLLQLAQFRGEVSHWCSVIFDHVSEAQLVTLGEELEREDFMRDFLAWFPDAADHRRWFEDLWAAILEELEERAEEQGDDGEED